VSENTATKRVSRALVRLRQKLNRHGIAMQEAGLAAALPVELCRATPGSLVTTVAKSALMPGAASPLSQIVLRHLAWQKMKLAAAIVGVASAVSLAAVGYHVLPNFHQAPLPPLPVINVSIARTWNITRGDEINASAMTRDGKFALTAAGNNFIPTSRTDIRLWDLDTQKVVQMFNGQTGRVMAVAFTGDERQAVTVSNGGSALLWDLASGKEINRIEARLPINTLSVSPDGRFAAFGSQRLIGKEFAAISDNDAPRLHVWDLQTGEDLPEFANLRQGVARVTFSPDGKRLGMAVDVRQIRIWRLGRTSADVVVNVSSPQIVSVAFSPDGQRLFAAGNDGDLYVFDGLSGVLAARWPIQRGLVHSMQLSADGKVLYTAGGTREIPSRGKTIWHDCDLHAWDARNGREISRFSGHSTGIWSMNISGDARRMLTAGGLQISLWDLEQRE
jgi:WD40 repeat protein